MMSMMVFEMLHNEYDGVSDAAMMSVMVFEVLHNEYDGVSDAAIMSMMVFEMLHNEYDGVSDAASGADSHVRGGPTRGEQGQEPIREHHCMYDDTLHWLASVTSVWVTLVVAFELFFILFFYINSTILRSRADSLRSCPM